MAYDFLMNTASTLFIVCYFPELYANWKNRNANFYNMPEKCILVLASGFAFTYALINEDLSLISNYGPILALDIIALAMRFYFMEKNKTTTALPQSLEVQTDSGSGSDSFILYSLVFD